MATSSRCSTSGSPLVLRRDALKTPSLFDIDPSSSELGSASGLWGLTRIPGVGSQTALAIAGVASSWSKLVEAPEEVIAQAGASRVKPHDLAAMGIEPVEPPKPPEGIQLIGYFDNDYPELLRKISTAPAVLWVSGSLPSGKLAAVVGTRNPTNPGVERVQKLVKILVEKGYGIVSGLALGVDTVAHEAALANGGRTWAYLGSGVDSPSPAENKGLAESIIASGGGLLSECDLSEPVSTHSLVARDRLQSGTSDFTIIGQSGVPSGTLHTARFTLQQERPLIVVAPPESEVEDSAWEGNKALSDPNGCNPDILKADTKKLIELIGSRKPVADVVLTNSDQLADFLEKRQ